MAARGRGEHEGLRRLAIHSEGNLYRSDTPWPSLGAFRLNGGSAGPFVASGPRIEGFFLGMRAAAGVRFADGVDPVFDNRVLVQLEGTRLVGVILDFVLLGLDAFDPLAGHGNSLTVQMDGVIGSGSGNDNIYVGDDVNRLVFPGTRDLFIRRNQVPPPDAAFFSAGR